MRETKIFQLLKGIPEDERKQFALFVGSPYFNSVPRLGKLLEVLEQHLLRYKVRQLSEQEVFALVMPDQAYDQNRFRKDCSALVKLLLQFMAQQQFDRSSHLHAPFMLASLHEHQLDAFFPSYHHLAMEALQSEEVLSLEEHELHVRLGILRYLYDIRQASRGSDIDVDDLIAHQDDAYLIRKMELCYIQLNHRLVTGKGRLREDSEFMREMAARIRELPDRTQMFFHLYQCTLSPEKEDEYMAFKGLLSKAILPFEDREEMYTAALNYCARRLNAGHPQYLRESFSLYQELLGQQATGTATALLSSHFKNIVMVACKLEEFAWVKQFVTDYIPHLQGDNNRNAFHFSLGCIAFHEGQFAQAEPYLYRVLDDYEDIFYGIDARVILLRIHYETENIIGLDSLADSFRMYIKRNAQLSGTRKANLQTFIRHLRKLAHTPKFDRAALQKLRDAVQQDRKITATQWLISQIEQNLQN